MPAALYPQNEAERVAALIALRILDTERSEAFDIFPALAKDLFGVPVSALSLVAEDRQWFKASVGLKVTELPRLSSFCAHAILNPEHTLVVADATKDPRFSDNPLVTGDFGLRFYAGAPITGPSGHALGALCIIDRKPREIVDIAVEQLRLLAVGASGALKLHGSAHAMDDLTRIDPLTGLENRASLTQRFRTRLTPHDGSIRRAQGLLLIDLDDIRAINVLFGHRGGDTVLVEISQRLRRLATSCSAIGRLGGGTFCIVVESLDARGALQELADAVRLIFLEPFQIAGQSVLVRITIGAAVGSEADCDLEHLMLAADAALSEAKRAGPGETRFVAPGERAGDVATRGGRRAMEIRLREALLPPGREPFALAFQPLFEAKTKALTGFEALVRWPDENGPTLQPGDFIPIAEATGLIVQLDHWVLDQACSAATAWPSSIKVSANLSAANFFAGDLVMDVRTVLDRHGLSPSRLKLEVTETVLLHDAVRVRRIIMALQALGVRVVLDDFGAGYGSVAYLRDYSFDGLKVDRSLTADIVGNTKNQAFTRAVIEMAGALGMEVTAEGVETQDQLDLLCGSDVATVQGYFLGRPMPANAAYDLAWR